MADLARKLLSAGKMYADDTGVEQMREERLKCVESARRGMAPAEAMRVFEEMLAGSEVRSLVYLTACASLEFR